MPSPFHGQTSALSGTAQQLDPTNTASSCKAFTLKAPITNAASVFVGAAGVTTTNGHAMDPGDEITYERVSQNGQPAFELRPSDFYAVGTGPDVLTWLASP